MIGMLFQQVANQYGLKTSQGVAFGTIHGYPVTFLDGIGCHRIMVTTRFATPSQKDALMDIVNAQELKSLYNLKALQIAKKVIHIKFRQGSDIMERVNAFVEWFFPLLEQNGASKATICPQCQEAMTDEEAQWILRDGAVAFRVHKHCAEELKESLAQSNSNGPSGSIVKAIGGALLGALAGSLLWVILQYFNFYAPAAGLICGWLSVFLYRKWGGRTGFVQYPIVIVCSVLGIGLGVVLAEVPALLQLGAGWNVFGVFFENMRTNYGYMSGIWRNLSMGLILGALGLFFSFKSAARKDTDNTVTDLEL